MSRYGEFLHLTIFGQSHAPAIGMILERASSCSASAPAKHSGAVSRPENGPPPRMSFAPATRTIPPE